MTSKNYTTVCHPEHKRGIPRECETADKLRDSSRRKAPLGMTGVRAGLTLIELLIVMSLVAILAAALWGNFFTSLTKGRDSRRKQDLDAVGKAVELYYNDNRAYPLPTVVTWGSAFRNPSNSAVVYMQKLPTDPSDPTYNYCYYSDGTYYKMYATLENTSDPKIIPTVACPPASATYYNYGISSPNTTP